MLPRFTASLIREDNVPHSLSKVGPSIEDAARRGWMPVACSASARKTFPTPANTV